MKKVLILSLIIGILAACSNDDDLPQVSEIVVNEFCYGLNGAENAEVSAAFNKTTESVVQGVFTTEVNITGPNFSILDNDRLDGTGFLINLTLVSNENIAFQPGNYLIDPNTEIANAQVSYFEDFDTASTMNLGIVIESGIVVVRPYSTGYYIRIDGVDSQGNDFHGIYLGDSRFIL